jgi:hypothetical protein
VVVPAGYKFVESQTNPEIEAAVVRLRDALEPFDLDTPDACYKTRAALNRLDQRCEVLLFSDGRGAPDQKYGAYVSPSTASAPPTR